MRYWHLRDLHCAGRRATRKRLFDVVGSSRRPFGNDLGRLVDDGQLSEVQQAFVDAGAYQCSFCIPGFVLAVHAGLKDMPTASAEDMKHYLAGNLCRCGTYPQIMDAVNQLLDHRERSQ